mmetsp:Transcript_10560/g.14896  ORF Transcript_10560/g.14896 Transcript_10560/m.14896 type:complete len:163 (+) Transcript_10560:383-871(+)
MTKNLHYEAELVVAIGKRGLQIDVSEAMDHVYGYAIGCDLTRRDIQSDAKKMGRPWASAKGFDFSAPCGPIVPKNESMLNLSSSVLSLSLNGEKKQESTLSMMTWDVPNIISHLSKYFCLKPGDLIMTGTPSGVGATEIGDFLKITCGELPICEFAMGDKQS